MRKNTAKAELIECIGSWPGILLAELIEEGGLSYSRSTIVAAVTVLRQIGLVEQGYPARLRVRPGWQKVVLHMLRRDRIAAAAISAGAVTYKQLAEVTDRTVVSCYNSGSRLTKAGAIYNSRGLYLTPRGQHAFVTII